MFQMNPVMMMTPTPEVDQNYSITEMGHTKNQYILLLSHRSGDVPQYADSTTQVSTTE